MLEAIFLFIHNFFEQFLIFGGFLFVPHLVNIYAKTLDERGWNFMRERTLACLFVLE